MNTETTNKSPATAPVHSSDGLADSPTWPYVLAFALRMEAKLEKNRHKGDRSGWLKDDAQSLFARLREEAFELEDALRSVKSKMNVVGVERMAIINEAADVANFAMMIADKFGGCEPKSANDALCDGGPQSVESK